MPQTKPVLVKIMMALFLLACAATNISAVAELAPGMAYSGGVDFRIFRTAAAIVNDGRGEMLFDYATQIRYQQQLFPYQVVGNNPLPFNHLAYESLLFLVLVPLSNAAAYFVWLGMNVVLLCVSLWLVAPAVQQLWQWLPGIPVLITLALYPVGVAMLQGQDSILSFFIYAVTFACLRRELQWGAGAVLALGLFKPQLVVLFALLAFLVERRWKALAGFAVGGVVVAAISLAVTGWIGVLRFVSMTRGLQAHRPWLFAAYFMPNLRGITQSLLSTPIQPLPTITLLVSAVLLLGVAWYQRRIVSMEIRFAVQLLATILVSYHLFAYDLTLVLIPVVLCGQALLSARVLVRWITVPPLLVLTAAPLHSWMVLHLKYFWMAAALVWLLLAMCWMGREAQAVQDVRVSVPG